MWSGPSSQGEGRLVEEGSLGPQSLNGWRQSTEQKPPNIMQCRRIASGPVKIGKNERR